MKNRLPLSELLIKLADLYKKRSVLDQALYGEAARYCEDLAKTLTNGNATAATFRNFWPPRLVKAMKANRLICFFGSGLSLPSGLPTWTTLLTREFPLDASFQTDQDLENDPLTRAELSSHRLGAEALQDRLRASHKGSYEPTLSHYWTAALRLPHYITTNYDGLFEDAWKHLYGSDIRIVLNEADLLPRTNAAEPLLFKIHGSIHSDKEHLILTRSDYRRHYRDNVGFFKRIQELLFRNDTLFLGFGHKDPEVTRLVDEAIWQWEDKERKRKRRNWPHLASPAVAVSGADLDAPSSLNFYSLQFDMKSHVPEIFAARGIVALEPSRDGLTAPDLRTASLVRDLIDLCGVCETNVAEGDSLDERLEEYASTLSSALSSGLDTLARQVPAALSYLLHGAGDAAFLADLMQGLEELASQGVYLLDEDGVIQNAALPDGLTNPQRKGGRLGQRPYFRQARTFRSAFVSDAFISKFNGHATVALCIPILEETRFRGLLFSACQIGSWRLPLDAARRSHDQGLRILIVDSNGVCLLPSEPEIKPEVSRQDEACAEPGNTQRNIGFPFVRLLEHSRRDKLVSRIMENVIPLGQDDDVLTLAGDLKLYSVVTELYPSRWKVVVSRAVTLARE